MKSRFVVFISVAVSFLFISAFFVACSKKSESTTKVSAKEGKAIEEIGKFVKVKDEVDPNKALELIDKASNSLPDIVASVNKVEIGSSSIKTSLRRFKTQAIHQGQMINEEQIKQMINQIVDSEIQRELLYQRGKELKIEASDEEISKVTDMMKSRLNSEEEFLKKISEGGLTLENLKKQIGRNLLISKLFKKEVYDRIEINEQQAMDYYKDNEKSFSKPETIRASHILFKVTRNMSDEEKKAAREKAEDILKKAKAGEDFAELAKKHSEGPSASRGGDLSDVSKGQMVPKFEEALFKLNAGEISDIVETQFGYHIIKAFDRKAGGETVPFDQAKENILSYLKRSEGQQKSRAYIENLRKEAVIKKFI